MEGKLYGSSIIANVGGRAKTARSPIRNVARLKFFLATFSFKKK